MFASWGHDNGLSFFDERDDLRRCPSCRELLAKWDEDLSCVPLPQRLKYDVSSSYDGVLVGSPRFRALYESAGMSGLRFTPLGTPGFALQASQIVEFDAEAYGTRLLDRCAACGRFESVIGATPAILKPGAVVPTLGFARTDLEFGSADEKCPLLLCGDGAADALRQAKLAGLELEAAVAGGH